MNPSHVQLVATVLFAIALLHTFSTQFFERLAEAHPRHAGIWHLLAEVEIVFGFWAMVLIIFLFAVLGRQETLNYVDSRNFTEPMFVFGIMVIAGTRAVLQAGRSCVTWAARLLPLPREIAFYFTVLSLVPLLGSFITEPAAMTLAALMLRERFFSADISNRLKYATLGVLFVNVSIGGTLTPYAAPPILMVASTWGWDLSFMLSNFAWKATPAVLINAGLVTLIFSKELIELNRSRKNETHDATKATAAAPVPWALVALHLIMLVGVVIFAHHPKIFMGLLLFFMGIATAYPQHQDRLILREGLLVAFFLSGLVVLGGMQQWWLQPVLLGMSSDAVFWGATALTAITDNAALTYLGSLVPGLSDEFKYALVAGAVTGGGLTVIANAPNPAGMSILRGYFNDGVVHPGGLFLAALLPTVVAALAFKFL